MVRARNRAASPQKRTRRLAYFFCRTRRGIARGRAIALADRVNVWKTRLRWLIGDLLDLGCMSATKMRPFCALAWREASMKQRSPALET